MSKINVFMFLKISRNTMGRMKLVSSFLAGVTSLHCDLKPESGWVRYHCERKIGVAFSLVRANVNTYPIPVYPRGCEYMLNDTTQPSCLQEWVLHLCMSLMCTENGGVQECYTTQKEIYIHINFKILSYLL